MSDGYATPASTRYRYTTTLLGRRRADAAVDDPDGDQRRAVVDEAILLRDPVSPRAGVVVARRAADGLAADEGDAEAPPHAHDAVAAAGRVAKSDAGLGSAARGGERQGDGVAGPAGRELRGEALAHPLQRPGALRER